MTSSASIEESRDQAFRSIGRNLTNFQLMEAMLKVVVTNATFSSAASEAQKNFKLHAKKIRATSFGQLVESFPKSLSGQADEPPDGAQLPWVSFSISSTALPPEALRQLRVELRRIVRDRNQLTHHMLADIDHTSIEAWNALGTELDAQNQRTLQVFERVKFLAAIVQNMRQTLVKNANAIAETVLQEAPPNDA
jgi:hypothetical protein